MSKPNPYTSADTTCQVSTNQLASLSTDRWMGTGFIIFAAMPVVFGGYQLYLESTYAAALPPGVGACGTGAVVALIIIVFGGPFCGLVGALLGWIAFKCFRGKMRSSE